MLRRGRFVSIASVHGASEAEEWSEKKFFAEIWDDIANSCPEMQLPTL